MQDTGSGSSMADPSNAIDRIRTPSHQRTAITDHPLSAKGKGHPKDGLSGQAQCAHLLFGDPHIAQLLADLQTKDVGTRGQAADVNRILAVPENPFR